VATETFTPEETASSDREIDRWLAVSEPLAIDDDPDWELLDVDLWRDAPHLRSSPGAGAARLPTGAARAARLIARGWVSSATTEGARACPTP